MHKVPCGLELCPWTDVKWENKVKVSKEKGSVKWVKITAGHLASAKAPIAVESISILKGIKRKTSNRHCDNPAPRAAKRTKIDYEDKLQAGSTKEGTCFFWYHGRCGRSSDHRNNYQCDYKHYLTDPPAMVCPPSGYVHPRPCGLEWCPGDATQVESVP